MASNVIRTDLLEDNYTYAVKVEKNCTELPGFDPITFSENSNHGRESLLEV